MQRNSWQAAGEHTEFTRPSVLYLELHLQSNILETQQLLLHGFISMNSFALATGAKYLKR